MLWNLWLLIIWCALRDFNFVYCLLSEKGHHHHYPLHHVYWNSSNPIFTEIEGSTNAVNRVHATPVLNAHLLDTIVIHCPHYQTQQFRDLTEQSTLYLVSRASFDGCQLDSTSKLLGYCDQLNYDRAIRLTLKRRGSKLGKFLPGRNYFILTTSTGTADGLFQRKGGLCATKNMRLKIHILKDPYKTMKPVKIWMDNSLEANNFVSSRQNDNDVLFMTEEFNELTWKKQLHDPRIPKYEKQQFGVSSPLIAETTRNRIFRKFPRIHKVEDEGQAIPFLMHHHEMRHQSKNSVMHNDNANSHVNDAGNGSHRYVEPRFRKIRHKNSENGRFSGSSEYFGSPEQSDAVNPALQEFDDDFDAASLNDITDKIELIRLDEYHQVGMDSKRRRNEIETDNDSSSSEKLMFYDRPTDSIIPLLSGVEARQSPGTLLFIVMFFYFHVRRNLWT